MALAAGYKLVCDDWQAEWVEATLARRKDGRWSAATSCLAVPRQNGKNGGIEVLELFGMVALGLKFLHTAHEVKTARKAFRRLLSFFENERDFPELAALVKEIRKTNGQEAILLKCRACIEAGSDCKHDHGGGVEFVARSSGSGRGFTVDVLVCDECQDLTDDELAALLPTIAAAPSGNPQVVLTGTPPDPEKAHLAKGEVFRRVRNEAANGTDPSLCFFDHGIGECPLPDVDNRDLWHAHNPALGIRLGLPEVIRERKMMSPETFARERLGWWGDPETVKERLLPNWPNLAADEVPPRPVAVGVAVSLDCEWAAIASAGRLDSVLHVGIAADADGVPDHQRGTAWLIPRLKYLQATYDVRVVIDSKCPDKNLASRLRRAGLIVNEDDELSTEQMLDAHSAFEAAVRDGAVTHLPETEITAAIASAVKRNVGDRWLYGRRQSRAEITCLEAAALAFWAVENDDSEPTIAFL